MKKGRRFVSRIASIIPLCVFALLSMGIVSQSEAETKKPYNIEIYTYKVGTFTYSMGVALADFINKQSSWLKATAIEAAGDNVTTRIVATEPAMKKKIIGFMNRWTAGTGSPPFREAYPDIREIAVIGFVINGLVTLDPAIKSVRDLGGKRVGLGTSPSVERVDMPKAAVLAAGAEKVRFSEHGFTDGIRALTDGMIDSLFCACFMVDSVHKKFAPNPALTELMATKKVHFVSFDEQTYASAHKQYEAVSRPPFYCYVVPPEGVKGQSAPWVVQGATISWGCDKSMPEEVVYEITRIMAENSADFKKYHPLGRSITPENMARLGDEGVLHAGALKYYKEQGIPIGSF